MMLNWQMEDGMGITLIPISSYPSIIDRTSPFYSPKQSATGVPRHPWLIIRDEPRLIMQDLHSGDELVLVVLTNEERSSQNS